MTVKSAILRKLTIPTALSFVLAASVIASPVSAATSFSDVSERYEQSVNYLVNQDITNGISKTKFGIDQNIKRGDAAIILAHALGLTEKDAPASGFKDVPTRGVVAINALKDAGIVNGKSAKSFGFNDLMKRGEMALMLTKTTAYDLEKKQSTLSFTDVNSRYAEAVGMLVESKIATGKSIDKFGTDDLLKRGEYALFMYKIEQTEDELLIMPYKAADYQGLWETKRANPQDAYLSVNLTNVKGNTATVQVDSMSSGAMYIGSVEGEAKFVGNKARIYYVEDGFGGSGVVTITLLDDAIAVTVVKSNEIGYLFEGKYKTYKQ
ncbi:S-layer homology domain-containing protein [Planococcus sp. N064]|uniref:S-layer homology domain-containing protein n=1 Tax=Planococcus liqunii TaxID=3058394 RepID=A0ABT8MNE2_9BACL|nr:S-layer homology domain-containing protein [Planococcus sp. N064]MDN7226417.1 S-layer homology domain-containing protein [Planococcus sp. N064]